jgi:hypothetical protein
MSAVATLQPTVEDAVESTLQWLDRQGGSKPASDRRATTRRRYRVQAQVTYLPAGARRESAVTVATRNLSRTGLSFLHHSLIYPRQPVEVRMPLPDGRTVNFLAKVIRVRLASRELYEIAVEFTALDLHLA